MISNKDLIEKYSILSSNIKTYRLKNHLTQEKLAEKADLSISYIKQLESGREYKNITFASILKIANALNIDITDLLKHENIKHENS